MENSDYKKLAEELAYIGYDTRLDSGFIDTLHIALDAVGVRIFEGHLEFRAKLRRYHRAAPGYQEA